MMMMMLVVIMIMTIVLSCAEQVHIPVYEIHTHKTSQTAHVTMMLK